MNVTGIINPSAGYAHAADEGGALHNQAHALEHRGDFAGAEALFLRAIDVKEQGLRPGNKFTANSQNALGELYLKLERLDEAEDMLKRALHIRKVTGTAFDAAVTRENLGQLYEMKNMGHLVLCSRGK
ncbi:hypothetical protein EWM64_g2062 [Hericium alpestre]|uniref:Uncharacterized protein n=1 Tax=Hericium alpestre TaxID=135208 RepID=A0A4Z0A4H8_9AGAM|nr:hypothetical protein EWM64_g2062 [Hericium alpestre]